MRDNPLGRSDFVQIGIRVTSDKCDIQLDNFSIGMDEYAENLPPEQRFMTNYRIDLFAVDDEERKIADIGFLDGILFEAECLIAQEIGFVYLCDSTSPEVYEMAEAITDRRGNIKPSICPPECNITYIKHIFVEPQYRKQGTGRYLLDNLNPLLRHALSYDPHVCFLAPYPQKKSQYGGLEKVTENAEAELEKLRRFYTDAGYRPLDGSSLMYKKLTDDLFAFLYGESDAPD